MEVYSHSFLLCIYQINFLIFIGVRAWLNRVPSLINDRENSVQEKCLDALESVILDNIAPYER